MNIQTDSILDFVIVFQAVSNICPVVLKYWPPSLYKLYYHLFCLLLSIILLTEYPPTIIVHILISQFCQQFTTTIFQVCITYPYSKIKPSDPTVTFSHNDLHGSFSQLDVLLTFYLEYVPRIELPDLNNLRFNQVPLVSGQYLLSF